MTEERKIDVDHEVKLYQKGFVEGAKHSKMSPETKTEIDELKTEWHDMKILFRRLLIGGIALGATYGVWVGTITIKILHNEDDIRDGIVERHEVGARLQAAEIVNAEIKTKLISIEATLLEIKEALR